MAGIEAVIFDIGNVLIEWQPENFYDRVIGPDRRKAFFDALDMHAMHQTIDEGAPFRETVYTFADENPEWRAEIRMWHDNWAEIAAPAIPDSVRLLEALSDRGMPVFALTNFGAGNFPVTQAAFPFLTRFHRTYVSGRLKMVKPDPAIYAHVEQDCGLPPRSLLFTDDRAENIETARARGWQVHLFDGPQGLASRLVAEGLLTEKEAV